MDNSGKPKIAKYTLMNEFHICIVSGYKTFIHVLYQELRDIESVSTLQVFSIAKNKRGGL